MATTPPRTGGAYVSPIAQQRMKDIAASNAKLAGGASYVSPIVKQKLKQNAAKAKPPGVVPVPRRRFSPLTAQLAGATQLKKGSS